VTHERFKINDFRFVKTGNVAVHLIIHYSLYIFHFQSFFPQQFGKCNRTPIIICLCVRRRKE